MNPIFQIPKILILGIIRLYQKTISPDHGIWKDKYPQGYCKYKPTCSEYTYQAIQKRGIIKGIILGTWRIIRCNPLSKGGYDPI